MLTKEEAIIRVQQLRKTLAESNRLYYVENAPVLSDFEFDSLMRELSDLEALYPELQTQDSPTRHVGSDLDDSRPGSREFAQYPHRYPMLSLGNTYDITEVEAFVDRAARSLGNAFTFSCELKFDGTAICLTYRKGILFRALTRGDGTVGDDVTENVRHIANIPQKLSGTGIPDEFEIRGEIYMPYKAFDRLNKERERDEDPPFANPRNAASGSLKLLDPAEQVVVPGLERLDLKDVGLDQIAVADGVEAAVGLLDEGAGAGQRGDQLPAFRLPGGLFPAAGGGETERHGGCSFPGCDLSSKDMYSLDKYSRA